MTLFPNVNSVDLNNTGCPNKHGNSVTNSISSLLWISIVIPNVFNVSTRWRMKTDKFTLFLYCNFLVLLSTIVCSENINKQIVNKADENLTDYSFLMVGRYHFTKSKNFLKRRYWILHWIPMFIGTPYPVHHGYIKYTLSGYIPLWSGHTTL